MKRLIYADTFSVGAFHEVYNSSSLLMFAELFDEVKYYSTKSSCKSVDRIIGGFPENVTHHSIFLLDYHNSFGNFIRHFLSSIWNIIILLKASKEDLIFYNLNSLWSTAIINKICKYTNKNVILMCHGEFEYLSKNVKLNLLSSWSLSLFQSQKFKVAPSLYFCVLGESILNNLRSIVPEDVFSKFISFEHTFLPQKVKVKPKNDSQIKVGTVGMVRNFKGLDNILQFAEMLKPSDRIDFYTLGRICCNPDILLSANIKFIPNADKDFVNGDVLNDYISQMDYLVFLYPIDGYKFTASGALLDAINNEKIILSLRNDYFENVFQKINCGILFDSIKDIVDYIEDTSIRDKIFVDFKENKRRFSPQTEALVFKEKLHKIFNLN